MEEFPRVSPADKRLKKLFMASMDLPICKMRFYDLPSLIAGKAKLKRKKDGWMTRVEGLIKCCL